MKRHRKISALTLILALLMLTLYGCGAAVNKASPTESSDYNYSVGSAPAYDRGGEYGTADSGKGDEGSGWTNNSLTLPETKPNTGSTNTDAEVTTEKIIYTGYGEIETVDFDKSVEQVYTLVERYGGFIQSSYVTGKDYNTQYYGRDSYRRAHFSVRVPKDKYASMTDSLTELGNVTYSSNEAQNITSAYVDTESRLKAYRIEEERLLEILEKADTVADMITIEDRLSTVRYNIESLTSQLKNWDSQVNYSTVELELREVKELSDEPVLKETFWQEIKRGVTNSVKWLISFSKNAVIFIASALPILIVPVIIIAVIVLLIRANTKRKKQRKEDINKTDREQQ